MAWKDWSYWLKGGIYALFIYGILTVILIPFGIIGGGCSGFLCINIPYYFLPALLVTFFYGGFINSPATAFVIASFEYFIIGALIGWIYGKIKSKK